MGAMHIQVQGVHLRYTPIEALTVRSIPERASIIRQQMG